LDAWEDSVNKREGELNDSDSKRMLMSTETMLGIRITSKYYIYSIK